MLKGKLLKIHDMLPTKESRKINPANQAHTKNKPTNKQKKRKRKDISTE